MKIEIDKSFACLAVRPQGLLFLGEKLAYVLINVRSYSNIIIIQNAIIQNLPW